VRDPHEVVFGEDAVQLAQVTPVFSMFRDCDSLKVAELSSPQAVAAEYERIFRVGLPARQKR
jgi:hypothetical protein